MRVEGVRRATDRLEIEGDARLGAQRGQPRVRLGEPRRVGKLGAHIGAAVETSGWDRGIELIGPPTDARPALPLQRPLQPSLAEVAPGTDDIADNINNKRLRHAGASLLTQRS